MCDEVDEEGENSGCWVECTVCNRWYHLDCSGALECLYSNLEEFDFYDISFIAIATTVDFKNFYYYLFSDTLTAAFLYVFSLMKFNSK